MLPAVLSVNVRNCPVPGGPPLYKAAPLGYTVFPKQFCGIMDGIVHVPDTIPPDGFTYDDIPIISPLLY